MQVRRVVTGQRAGRSVFVGDEQVAPITVALAPGTEFHRIWHSDVVPTLPTDGAEPVAPQYFPPAGGFRFGFFTLPPQGTALSDDIDVGAAFTEMQQRLPGMAEVMEPDHPGMHTTDTVDFEVVLSGEVTLELDDGAEVQLRAGDVVVQNGTRHAWHNRSDAPTVIAVAIFGATRA